MMRKTTQRGFSMVELLIAALVLLFGVAAVVQLVPNAMQANLRARMDSTSVVIAQRMLDQLVSQALNAPTFTNADGQVCALGNPAAGGFVGHAVVTTGGLTTINFNVAAITAGYGYDWRDPNDPSGPGYEIRWAVLTRSNGATPAHKRFVVGVWKRGLGGQRMTPVTLEGGVGR